MYRACETCPRPRPYGRPAQVFATTAPARWPTLPGDRRSEGTPPKESRQNVISVARCCVQTPRGQERPVDGADTVRIFRDRGPARARAQERPVDCGYTVRRFRHRGLARARPRWTRAPAKKLREKAFGCGRGPRIKQKGSEESKDHHRSIYIRVCT